MSNGDDPHPEIVDQSEPLQEQVGEELQEDEQRRLALGTIENPYELNLSSTFFTVDPGNSIQDGSPTGSHSGDDIGDAMNQQLNSGTLAEVIGVATHQQSAAGARPTNIPPPPPPPPQQLPHGSQLSQVVGEHLTQHTPPGSSPHQGTSAVIKVPVQSTQPSTANLEEIRKQRRRLNTLRGVITSLLNRIAVFYSDQEDKNDTVIRIDDMKDELSTLRGKWQDIVENLTDLAIEDFEPNFPNEAAVTEDHIRGALQYLKILRNYLTDMLQLNTTESTFDSAPRRHPQQIAAPATDWRSSTRLTMSDPPPEFPLNDAFAQSLTQHDSHGELSAIASPTGRSQNPPSQLGQSNTAGRAVGTRSLPLPPDWKPPMAAPGRTPPTALARTESAAHGQHPNEVKPHPGGLPAGTSSRESPENYLPKLSKNFELPKFGGDVKDYRKFINTFNTFVHDREIPELQKMILLTGALSGKAYHCVKHLDLSVNNYPVIRQILERKFGDEDRAGDSHIRALDHILSSGGDIAYDKLPHFVNSISQHLLALISRGDTYVSLSTAYAPKILSKLSTEMQRSFRVYFKDTNKQTFTCKLEALVSFLEEEASTAEAIAESKGSNSKNGKNSKFNPQGRNPQQPKSNFSSSGSSDPYSYKNKTNNFHVSTSQGERPMPPEPKRKLKVSCIFCEGDHAPFRCDSVLSPQERKERAMAKSACLKCLKLHHEAKNCREVFKKPCRFCKGKHYSIICTKAPADMNQKEARHDTINLKAVSLNSPIFLWTAHVWAEVGDREILCRILIDPGSQSSHVTHSMVKKLSSKPESHINMAMSTAGGRVTNIHNCGIHNITLRSRFDPNKAVQIRAIELKCLSRAKFPINRENFGLSPVADHVLEGESEWIDILLGSDKISEIEFSNPKSFQNIFAFDSIFGWIFGGSGNPEPSPRSISKFCGFAIVQTTVDSLINTHVGFEQTTDPSEEMISAGRRKDQTMEDIKFLWQAEGIGLDEESGEMKEEEDDLNKALIDNYKKTTHRDKSGRYIIRLQFKDNILSLQNNRDLSLSRLHSFLGKLAKDPERLKSVDDEIKKNLEAGFIEPAKPKRPNQVAHYLPVQAVFKTSPENPGKLSTRVVKDAGSRKPNEPSLNDCLHVGPSLLPNLIDVIMKFRQYKYTLTADIRKAFNQFLIAEEDRTVLRFLWPLSVSTDARASIREFWTTRLDFGLISAPFLHCQGIRTHLEHAQRQHPDQTPFLEEIKQSFYMDDICFGGDSIEEAKTRMRLLSEVFQEGCFPLAKWTSNDAQLGQFVEETSPVPETIVSVTQTNGKFLGIPWNQESDTLSVQTEKALGRLTSNEPSKRNLLTGMALIFDPLGILAPTTITAKTLLQSLWKANCPWDKPLNEAQAKSYNNFIDLLRKTREVTIPRHLKSVEKMRERQLCCFSDASLSAYATVCYIREIYENAEPRVFFVMAKSKPAPVRPISIARLELLACLLGAKIMNTLKTGLHFKIDSCFMFTDNSSVLTWVNSEPEKWKAFVANRIRRIHALCGDASFGFVRSKSNPSDIASRGLDISDRDTQKLWLQGPSWLLSRSRTPTEELPLENAQKSPHLDIERKPTISACFNCISDPTKEIFFENRCTSWIQAIRFWAFIRRLKKKITSKRTNPRNHSDQVASIDTSNSSQIAPEEMIEARLDLIRLIQATYFADEFRSRCNEVRPSSVLKNFNPFMGEDGIIRCRTRLERSDELTENQRHPIILPSNSFFSKLVIRDVHERRNFHSGGMAMTLHRLRQDYLILHARKLSSVTSRRTTAKFRIERAPGFCHVGLDFAGPFRYKKDNGEVAKGYLLIITCAVTRAVHVELTTDLSTWEVLGALQKFVSRFPAVRTITSDNGASFRSAARELKSIYDHIVDGRVRNWLAKSFITWRFITPTAAAHNGFTERAVQMIKRPLRKILGSAIPHFRDLEVIVARVASMVNSRPITAVTTSTDELEALSPTNLLYGHQGDTVFPLLSVKPTSKADADKITHSKRWKYQQRLLNAFWKRYQGEYLCYLKTAHKQKNGKSNPIAIGDVCLLEDPSSNRGLWPLCRVIALPENANSAQARSCTIRTAQGQTLNRPIYKLFPIQRSE